MDPLTYLARGIQIGIDIGQRVDPTAIAVAELQHRDYTIREDQYGVIDATPMGGALHYVIRYLDKMALGTPYPKVAERLAEIYRQLQSGAASRVDPDVPAGYRRAYGSVHQHGVKRVYVDATGVGKPVVDLLRAGGTPVTAVYLTGGDKVTREGGELRIAKAILISNLQVLLQQRRVHLPDTAVSKALVDELLNYEIKVTEAANLQMGVFKTGKHDDLATALALACWQEPDNTITVARVPPALADALYGRYNGDTWRG